MCLLEKVISKTLLHIFSFPPILLDDVLDDIICLINTDAMFTLDDSGIGEIYPCPPLQGEVKESIKSLNQSF